ncbi:hypothetical protein ACLOJK_000071 [Asimina triloba]
MQRSWIYCKKNCEAEGSAAETEIGAERKERRRTQGVRWRESQSWAGRQLTKSLQGEREGEKTETRDEKRYSRV